MAPEMTDVTLYGIPTCDTCKRAMKDLAAAGHDVTFHDVRADPLTPAQWDELLLAFGDRLINRASTTYRGLSDWMKASDPEDQLAQHPALMKRPVIRTEDKLYLGWDSGVQAALLE